MIQRRRSVGAYSLGCCAKNELVCEDDIVWTTKRRKMSNEEYAVLELKRFLATLYFKYTIKGVSTKECISMADKLIKELD